MTAKPIYQKTLDALRRREGLFRVLVFTLVTVVFWIGFSIYLSNTKNKIPVDIQKHTQQLNPNINRTALQELATRKKYAPEELQDFPIYERVVDDAGVSSVQIVGTSPVLSTETPIASATAEPIATPAVVEKTASPSAGQ